MPIIWSRLSPPDLAPLGSPVVDSAVEFVDLVSDAEGWESVSLGRVLLKVVPDVTVVIVPAQGVVSMTHICCVVQQRYIVIVLVGSGQR
jgi:hypothetical protein